MRLETINAILNEETSLPMEPLHECHPMEAAEVMGIADEVFPEVYPFADEMSVDYPF